MEDLGLLIKSRYPIVCVETQEEDRLAHALESVCNELSLALFTWSVTTGLRRRGMEQSVYDTQDPTKLVQHIQTAQIPSVYLLQDFHPYLKEPRIVRQLREIAQAPSMNPVTLVLSSPGLDIPPELAAQVARYEMRLPDEDELGRAVMETFRSLNRNHNSQYRLDTADLARLARNLRGLTLAEARRVISRCILDDGALDAADLDRVMSSRRERIQEGGVLEYFDVFKDIVPLGGLRGLKDWLRRYGTGFSARAREMGLRPPQGVLLLGIQGCGKSLAAKTIAREWNLALVRLDPARLFDKFVGESEKNLGKALATAEAIAPVVLWIDEIEKAFTGAAGSEADAGLGRRLFGSFLTWMQEKKDEVFVAATGNDVSSIPPELMRKGRFDEIFFVDLPGPEERREIFAIHLARRRLKADQFDTGALASASEGFSGAEIEQAVVAALYGMLADNASSLTMERLLSELRRTIPLSSTRCEDVQAMREYARGRFLPA
jgi:SpoVK/Ycf46/Vps4 family AAA+-type ATPase